MGFDKPKAPKAPAPVAKVEELDDSAKRGTILNQRKKKEGAAGTILANNQPFGMKTTL